MLISEELQQKVRQIEWATRRMVNDTMAGEYHSVFKGRGMEFDEVRPYAEGDDVRTIDWNVTARTGVPHVKRFVEERELTLLLMVDASGSLDFGTRRQMKGELAVEVCALMAFSAIRNNDRVGLLVFTDEVELFIPPRKGRSHVLRLIRDLLYFRPRQRGTNIPAALEYVRNVQRRRSVIFLFSDLVQQGIETALSLTARRHDLIVASIIDERELTLPAAGILRLRDPETGREVVVDSSSRAVRTAFEQSRQQARLERQSLLRRLELDHVELATGADYLPPLVRLFRARARRA
jgi:uncharacterized protein (DUF58 family)